MTMSLPEHAHKTAQNIQPIIGYMARTIPDDWQVDVVRSKCGSRNCFFGHLFNYGLQVAQNTGYADRAQEYANRLWEGFEEQWATTYHLYPINDGEHPDYPQSTPRERVISFLENLRDGKELTTLESMDRSFYESATVQELETSAEVIGLAVEIDGDLIAKTRVKEND